MLRVILVRSHHDGFAVHRNGDSELVVRRGVIGGELGRPAPRSGRRAPGKDVGGTGIVAIVVVPVGPDHGGVAVHRDGDSEAVSPHHRVVGGGGGQLATLSNLQQLVLLYCRIFGVIPSQVHHASPASAAKPVGRSGIANMGVPPARAEAKPSPAAFTPRTWKVCSSSLVRPATM